MKFNKKYRGCLIAIDKYSRYIQSYFEFMTDDSEIINTIKYWNEKRNFFVKHANRIREKAGKEKIFNYWSVE